MANLFGNNSTSNYRYVESVAFVAGIVTFYGIISMVALISNLFIIYVILRKYVRRNTVNVFLASLAFSDILMVILSTLDCYAFLKRSWVLGTWTCKIQSLLIEVSFTASTLTLVAVSVERYLLICHPHMKRRTMKVINITVSCLWTLALAICSPLLDGYVVVLETGKNGVTELICQNDGWKPKYKLTFYAIFSFVIYLIPLVIMAYAHWRISMSVKGRGPGKSLILQPNSEKKQSVCYTIREESSGGSSDLTAESNDMKRKVSGLPKTLLGSLNTLKRKVSSLDKEASRRERRMKAVRLLLVVTIVFVILWTPFVFFRLVRLSGMHINEYLYKFSEVLILGSTAVNAFIYAFMSPPFRKAFIKLLLCRSHKDIYSRDSGPSMSNSDDNRLSHRMSRGSSYSGCTYGGGDSRNGTLNFHSFSGNKTSV